MLYSFLPPFERMSYKFYHFHFKMMHYRGDQVDNLIGRGISSVSRIKIL